MSQTFEKYEKEIARSMDNVAKQTNQIKETYRGRESLERERLILKEEFDEKAETLVILLEKVEAVKQIYKEISERQGRLIQSQESMLASLKKATQEENEELRTFQKEARIVVNSLLGLVDCFVKRGITVAQSKFLSLGLKEIEREQLKHKYFKIVLSIKNETR